MTMRHRRLAALCLLVPALFPSLIQSLADLVNSYDAVRRMRLVPFGL